MSDSVHGHEVLHFLMEAERGLSKEGLQEAIEARFSAGTRFHTCSAQDLTAAELIDFLSAREILAEKDGGLAVQADRMCRH